MVMHVVQSSLIRQKRETAPLFKFENKLDHAKYNKVLRKRKKTQKEKKYTAKFSRQRKN